MKTIQPTISQLRMLASIRGNQWMIRLDSIQEFALAALDVPEKANALNISIEDFYEMRPPATVDQDGIGHVWIHSALVDSCPGIYEKLGICTRYLTIIGETMAAIDSGAKGIVYHVDSPGGTVAGNIEAAKMISGLGIPTVAHCHGLACSAAYKLSAGCGMIVASESATVGNIGTILSWTDCSKFWKESGIEFKAITNEGADLKSTFYLEPNEDQIAFLQDSINEAGKEFQNHVKEGRGKAGATLDEEIWRAGWYSGNRAGQLGLIDDIGTAEDARQYLLAMLPR